MSLETLRKVRDYSYDEEKWLYVQTPDKSNRFVLGTKGNNPLFCIGVNPSTASPHNLDPTLKNVERFASSFGFDSFVMFNIYPLRATNPNELPMEIDGEMHLRNLHVFQEILMSKNTSEARSNSCGPQNHIWAAWGTIIAKRLYLRDCLKDFIEIARETKAVWHKVGTISKDGHPHHPLYLKKESTLDEFDIETYIDMIYKK